MNKKINIVIIDDHQLFRDGLKSLFARNDQFVVIGEAQDAKSGLAILRDKKPDILLLDISLPGISGIEFCQRVSRQFPRTKIIILTMHQSDEFLSEAFKAGASAFILKHAAATELIAAIQSVRQGKKYISSDMTGPFIDKMLSLSRELNQIPSRLSAKETEIVRLVAQGLENQDIADALHISIATVKTHRANIMKKLGVHKNIDIVKYAIKNKLVEL